MTDSHVMTDMSKEAMKLALEALELINLEFVCANGSHHAKEDRHEWDEDCPITDRWRKVITALREALANEALERMAENARELGLDYDTSAQQEPVNEGWKLVPVEPTKDMWKAVNKLDDEMAAGNYDGKGCSIEQAWHCLLDASPTPPAQRTWVGLSDEDLANCSGHEVRWALYWEKLLKERNT